MSGRVEGKVAIVTGAGTAGSGVGIGHAISVINNQGTHVNMEPPLIGDAELARTEMCFETLTFPVQTLFGEVRVNVMIHDLD